MPANFMNYHQHYFEWIGLTKQLSPGAHTAPLTVLQARTDRLARNDKGQILLAFSEDILNNKRTIKDNLHPILSSCSSGRGF